MRKLMLTCATILTVIAATFCASAAPVAHWTFDDPENLGKDATGNGFDATIHGKVEAVPGKKGGAIRLGPGKNYLSVAYDPKLNPPAFTVAAWVKAPAPTTDWQVVVAGRDKGGFILYATKDGCYGFYLGFNGADRPRMTGPSQKGSKKERTIPAGVWTRIVGTFSPSSDKPNARGNYEGMAVFYMNGKVIETRGMEFNPNSKSPITIGGFAGARATFEGEIDDVAIWNTADPGQAHEGMEVVDPVAAMSPEERAWTMGLQVSDRAMKTREYYREAYAFVPDRPDKPNVLLIGDSISEGYTRVVRRILKDKADVYRIPQNGGHVLRGVENLVDSKKWLLGKKDWAVIHFNFGLHDLVRLKKDENGKAKYDVTGTPRHTHEVYEQGLDKIVKALKETGATVICALTTPVPPNSNGRVNGEEIPFNEVATRVAKANGIEIDDLHAPVVPVHEKIMASPGNVHYTEEGSEMLGKIVAGEIEKALDKR